MKSPFSGGNVLIKKESRILEYRKEKFEIVYHYYICEDTGEQFTNDQLDTLNQNQVLNKYRAKFGIPTVEEIRNTRKKYDLAASKMSEILGLGINVYRNYESGEVPSISIGRYIRLADDPEEFMKLVNLSKDSLNPFEYTEIAGKISKYYEPVENDENNILDLWLYRNPSPNIYNGFRTPDIKRIGSMVSYFSNKLQPFTTALNKLMFYADFGHYRKHGTSISGITYKALQRGPVPSNYGGIYNLVVNRGYAHVAEMNFGDFGGEKFLYDKEIVADLEEGPLSQSEFNTLENVVSRFKGMNTKQIVEISHDETAWIANIDNQSDISYDYSFELKHID